MVWRARLADQGEYTCTATNNVGDQISKTVNLKINGQSVECIIKPKLN